MSDESWTFATFHKYINQRFTDLSRQLEQRFDAQEKAVISALNAAEKAVDKSEKAQAMRNEAQNEFRDSLSDLSGLMWTTKEGIAALEGLRREMHLQLSAIEDKVNSMAKDAANIQGRFTMLGIVWGVIVVVASAAIRWFK